MTLNKDDGTDDIKGANQEDENEAGLMRKRNKHVTGHAGTVIVLSLNLLTRNEGIKG